MKQQFEYPSLSVWLCKRQLLSSGLAKVNKHMCLCSHFPKSATALFSKLVLLDSRQMAVHPTESQKDLAYLASNKKKAGDWAAGLIAGVAQTVVGHPFDTVVRCSLQA